MKNGEYKCAGTYTTQPRVFLFAFPSPDHVYSVSFYDWVILFPPSLSPSLYLRCPWKPSNGIGRGDTNRGWLSVICGLFQFLGNEYKFSNDGHNGHTLKMCALIFETSQNLIEHVEDSTQLLNPIVRGSKYEVMHLEILRFWPSSESSCSFSVTEITRRQITLSHPLLDE